MNKRVITSVSPKECELIASGRQTMLVRKTRPKIETPFKCYIYMTATKERCRLWEYITAYQNSKGEILNGSQKVIGSFVCDMVEEYTFSGYNARYRINDVDLAKTCLNHPELIAYGKGKDLYGLHITEPKLFDKPRELGEFLTPSGTGGVWGNHYLSRPPQSWCYVEA